MKENPIGVLTFAPIPHECDKCGHKWTGGFFYDICPKCGNYVL